MHSADDRTDLGRLRERHYPDARGVVEEWARQFILETPANTFNLLATMNAAIRGSFEYRAREEEGTQAPLETIEKKSGTCRDYALLFIEAARALGFGRAFVTGYLYDPSLDGGDALQGAARRTPGRRSICRAPAGSNSTRPTGWSRVRT
jgi:transglutaminase-like putative cysteine protease